jgi:predicted nicotinamide N-methyase
MPPAMKVHELAGLRIHAPPEPSRAATAAHPTSGRLPYWSRPWPSGVALAQLIAGELADRVRGRRVIELGCGLGITGMAAARAGADVTCTDGDAPALELVRENAERNGVTVATAVVEWSQVPPELAGRFDVVIGGDVVYDRAQIGALAAAIQALLAPGGEAWIAEAHRLGPTILVESAAAVGLVATLDRTLPYPDGLFTHDSDEVMDVHVYHLRRA